jgi:hypothetical protein
MGQTRIDRNPSGGLSMVRAACLVPVLTGLLMVAVAAAEPKLTFVDLQPKANHKLADSLHETEGNHLGNVPKGEQKMADTQFKIGEKMIHLRGQHATDAPEKVTGIAVDATFDKLHILHSCGYGEGGENNPEDGTVIGAYVVQYGDGSKERIPIRYGEDLRDWWDWPDRSTEAKKAKIAWTGSNPVSEQNQRQIRLFAVVWENPHPAKKVMAIDVESANTECDPFVVALTLERKE